MFCSFVVRVVLFVFRVGAAWFCLLLILQVWFVPPVLNLHSGDFGFAYRTRRSCAVPVEPIANEMLYGRWDQTRAFGSLHAHIQLSLFQLCPRVFLFLILFLFLSRFPSYIEGNVEFKCGDGKLALVWVVWVIKIEKYKKKLKKKSKKNWKK